MQSEETKQPKTIVNKTLKEIIQLDKIIDDKHLHAISNIKKVNEQFKNILLKESSDSQWTRK